MKSVVAAALLVAASAGLALAEPGNPCNASLSAPTSPYVDLASGAVAYPCAPSPIGGGSLPTLRSNTAGTVAWWYCPSDSGQWHLNWAAVTAARLSASKLFGEAYAVVTADDPKAAFNAATAKNVQLPLDHPSLTPVWCPFVAEMISHTPPPTTKPTAPKTLPKALVASH